MWAGCPRSRTRCMMPSALSACAMRICRMTSGASGRSPTGLACMDKRGMDKESGALAGAPHQWMENWRRLQERLALQGYVATPDLAMALHLALSLGRPLLLEGAAGVGKTEVARALSATLGAELIRLQCYEGLDAAQAIYEWNYQRQLLAIRAVAEDGESAREAEKRLF